MNVSDANYLAWISYSFLVFVGGTLLTIGCMRQFKRMTLYIYCSLLGLFFMMTPLLGIATQPGSLSSGYIVYHHFKIFKTVIRC